MYPSPKADLSVEFCGVRFAHPFILAAAPPTDDLEMVRAAFRAGWAGAVLKTTSVEGTPVPIAYPMMSGMDVGGERLMGMGNIDLISEHHIDVIEERIKLLKAEFPDQRVIASVSGSSREAWQDVVRRVVIAGCDMIECSFSCPQGSIGLAPGMMLGQSPEASAEVAGWIREAAGKTPVIIKLTPQVADIAEIAMAVKGVGADAVCVGNTVPALMGVDLVSFVPKPDVYGRSTYSGLSGPAIKPISLRCVSEISRKAGMSIAGSGGAVTWRDALEFILLGASVVEYCTAVMHYGFSIVEDLVEGLSFHLDRQGIARLSDIAGAALSRVVAHDELDATKGPKAFRPEVDTTTCVRCGLCVIACRDGGHQAISLGADRVPEFDDERCVGCALCSVMCPAHCIAMKERVETNDRTPA